MQDMFIALSGAMAMERRLATHANNLANAGASGYKADHVTVSGLRCAPDRGVMARSTADELDVEPPEGNFYSALYASLTHDAVDHREGVPRETNSPTDVMIAGDAHFVVNTPRGERYTRQGSFTLSPDRVLRTLEGFEVQGDNKREIEIDTPQFRIRPDGSIIDGEGGEIGQIRLVHIPDKQNLVKEGGALFRAEGAGRIEEADPDKVELRQGWVEGSNVEVVNELIDMIQIHRAYESFQRTIQTSDSLTGQLIRAMETN